MLGSPFSHLGGRRARPASTRPSRRAARGRRPRRRPVPPGCRRTGSSARRTGCRRRSPSRPRPVRLRMASACTDAAKRRAQAEVLDRLVVDPDDHDVVAGRRGCPGPGSAGRRWPSRPRRARRCAEPEREHGGDDTRRDDQEDAPATAIGPHRAETTRGPRSTSRRAHPRRDRRDRRTGGRRRLPRMRPPSDHSSPRSSPPGILAAPALAADGPITTFAGTIGGFAGDGGPAAAALARPARGRRPSRPTARC